MHFINYNGNSLSDLSRTVLCVCAVDVVVVVSVFSIFFELLSFFSSISGKLSTILFENQNTTTSAAMEMKYQHVGISN